MTKKERESLERRREELLREVVDSPLWVNGSVVETRRKQAGKVKPFNYLSRSIRGKNKITYVSSGSLDAFKEAAAQGIRVRSLLAEAGEITIQLLKAAGRDVQ